VGCDLTQSDYDRWLADNTEHLTACADQGYKVWG
jgi:hypothetical protein